MERVTWQANLTSIILFLVVQNIITWQQKNARFVLINSTSHSCWVMNTCTCMLYCLETWYWQAFNRLKTVVSYFWVILYIHCTCILQILGLWRDSCPQELNNPTVYKYLWLKVYVQYHSKVSHQCHLVSRETSVFCDHELTEVQAFCPELFFLGHTHQYRWMIWDKCDLHNMKPVFVIFVLQYISSLIKILFSFVWKSLNLILP